LATQKLQKNNPTDKPVVANVASIIEQSPTTSNLSLYVVDDGTLSPVTQVNESAAEEAAKSSSKSSYPNDTNEAQEAIDENVDSSNNAINVDFSYGSIQLNDDHVEEFRNQPGLLCNDEVIQNNIILPSQVNNVVFPRRKKKKKTISKPLKDPIIIDLNATSQDEAKVYKETYSKTVYDAICSEHASRCRLIKNKGLLVLRLRESTVNKLVRDENFDASSKTIQLLTKF